MARGGSKTTEQVVKLVIVGVALYWGYKHQDVIKGWIDKFSSSLNSQLGSGSSSTTANAQPSGDNSTSIQNSTATCPDGSTPDANGNCPAADAGGSSQSQAQVPDNSGNTATPPTVAAPGGDSNGTGGDSTGTQTVPAPQAQPDTSQAQAPQVAPAINCPQVIGPGCTDCCNVNGNCVCKGNSNCPCNGCPATVGTCAGDTPVTTGQVQAPAAAPPQTVQAPAAGGNNRHPNPRQQGLIQHPQVQPTTGGNNRHPNPRQQGLIHHPVPTVPPKTTVSNAPKNTNGATNVPNNIHRVVQTTPTNTVTPAVVRSRFNNTAPPANLFTRTPTTPAKKPATPAVVPQCTTSLPCGNTCLSGGARRIVCCLSGNVKTFVVNEAACHANRNSTGL